MEKIKELEVLPESLRGIVGRPFHDEEITCIQSVDVLKKLKAACVAYQNYMQEDYEKYNAAFLCARAAEKQINALRKEAGQSVRGFSASNNFSKKTVENSQKYKDYEGMKAGVSKATSEGRRATLADVSKELESSPYMSAAYWVSNAISDLKKAADVEKNEAKKAKWLWHVEELDRNT